MEPNKTFRIVVLIVTVSTLVTILTVESKSVPLSRSFGARSLLSVVPLSKPPSQSESPSPSPSEAPANSISPANPPNDLEAPAASPEAPANSISPTNPPTTEAPCNFVAPANPTTDSPAASPELPADSSSPTASPEAPRNPSSGPTLLNTPLLSPEIKTICSKTDYPTLCESSVSPLLTAQLKPDISSILILEIQASINATKEAMASIDKVAAAECQEMYDEAVTNLEDAISAVKARDIPTVDSNLSAAITDYSTCNDGFEESEEPNLLVDVGAKLTKMVSNCLAIATLIK